MKLPLDRLRPSSVRTRRRAVLTAAAVRAVSVCGLIVVMLCLPASPAAQQRIASLNLCTDLLLLELVEPRRIASLTYWASDPELSYLAPRARGIPKNRSLVGEIVPQQPDLILGGQFSDTQVVSLLRRLGFRVELLDVPLSLRGMRRHLLAFGELVGEPARARRLAERIERGIAEAAALSHPGTRSHTDAPAESPPRIKPALPLAAVYGPQGVSPGRDTLLHDLLHLAGYRNLAAEQGIVGYGTLSLEAVAMARPDVLVLDNLAGNRDSVAHWPMRHPALQKLFAGKPVIELPSRWTVCVGPPVVDAVAALAAGHSKGISDASPPSFPRKRESRRD